jgi:hypothetical protein
MKVSFEVLALVPPLISKMASDGFGATKQEGEE